MSNENKCQRYLKLKTKLMGAKWDINAKLKDICAFYPPLIVSFFKGIDP